MPFLALFVLAFKTWQKGNFYGLELGPFLLEDPSHCLFVLFSVAPRREMRTAEEEFHTDAELNATRPGRIWVCLRIGTPKWVVSFLASS